MNAKLLMVFLILYFGNFLGFAQTPEKKAAPTGLTLEVTFLKGRLPAYMTISESLATARWSWFGAFGRLPDFKTSAERPPVQAVKFIPYLDGGAVKVKVRVFTGEKGFDNEEDVAVYTMREGERASVKELTNFGVEPIEIAVVRVAPTVSALPSVENKTTSLQVTAIEPNFSTLPSYKLSVLNNSAKPVSAFTYETMENGRKRISAMPQNRYNENLIEPGATWIRELAIPLEYKQPVAGEIPKAASGQTIVISSVIFADGSYEGDAFRAAQFRAYVVGRRQRVKQLIALIQEDENNFSEYGFTKFVEQVSKLETKVDEQEFGGLLKQFPSLTVDEKAFLRDGVETASDMVKEEFMNETKRYQPKLNSADARTFLKGLKEQYQKWLARLQ
ncbi:MAG: hypothetical protein M3033_04285 [Acidobacteriota bacterium]|nr:hypothetical protein [Acidobacteriota bacterium]